MSLKVIFFGTPKFAAKVFGGLLADGVDIVAVVTKPDRPVGRSLKAVATPVKAAVTRQAPHIPVYQPEIVSELSFKPTLEQYDADLFVVVAYGEIIKEHLLIMPKRACINLHASLLPRWRGAAPIQRSIMNGDSEGGVTIIHMVKKMDAGDIIRTVTVPITNNMTYGELEEQLCVRGTVLLRDVIEEFAGGEPPRIPQDPAQITLAPKIELEDCAINWNSDAITIHNLVRGVNPAPVAWCSVRVKGVKKILKVYRTRIIADVVDIEPGKLVKAGKERYLIGCGSGVLELVELQLEGKKRMSAADLFRGIDLSTIDSC